MAATSATRTPTTDVDARSRLTAEQVAAAARVAALERDVADILESAKGGATDDEHDAEGATVAFERAQAMAMLEEARLQRTKLDHAVALLDEGRYGRCEACGQDIPSERLAARPSATLCISCASRRR